MLAAFFLAWAKAFDILVAYNQNRRFFRNAVANLKPKIGGHFLNVTPSKLHSSCKYDALSSKWAMLINFWLPRFSPQSAMGFL